MDNKDAFTYTHTHTQTHHVYIIINSFVRMHVTYVHNYKRAQRLATTHAHRKDTT